MSAATATTLDIEDLTSTNGPLAAQLASRGWVAETPGDYAAINKLTRSLFDGRTHVEKAPSINDALDAFIAKNTPPA